MSNNCLVTKLKATVDNPELDVLGYFKVMFESDGNFTLMLAGKSSVAAPEIKSLTGIGGVYTTTDSGMNNPLSPPYAFNFSAAGAMQRIIKGSKGQSIIIDKYDENVTGVGVGNINGSVVLDESVYYFTKPTMIRLDNGCKVKAPLDFNRLDCSALKELNLNYIDVSPFSIDSIGLNPGVATSIQVNYASSPNKNIIGDLSYFGNFVNLTRLWIPGTGITGSLKDLCDKLHENGKTSGTLMLGLSNTSIKYNDVTSSNSPRITFTEEGWTSN